MSITWRAVVLLAAYILSVFVARIVIEIKYHDDPYRDESYKALWSFCWMWAVAWHALKKCYLILTNAAKSIAKIYKKKKLAAPAVGEDPELYYRVLCELRASHNYREPPSCSNCDVKFNCKEM